MADELLHALAKRQQEADAADAPAIADAVDGDAGEALLDDLFGELDAKSADSTPRQAPTDDAPAEEAPSNVTELAPRRSAMWTAVAVAMAAAAALVLWFAMRTPAVPGMPAYDAVAISGGPAAVRGQHDAVASTVKLESPSGMIKWDFAPATSVKNGVEVALLAREAGGDIVYAKAPNAKVVESGSVRLRGPLDSFIELSDGTWTVEVIFAPEGHAPGSAQDAQAADWPRHAIEVIISAP